MPPKLTRRGWYQIGVFTYFEGDNAGVKKCSARWIVRSRKQIEERIRSLDEELKAERNAMLKLGTWGNFNESALEIKRLTAAVKKGSRVEGYAYQRA